MYISVSNYFHIFRELYSRLRDSSKQFTGRLQLYVYFFRIIVTLSEILSFSLDLRVNLALFRYIQIKLSISLFMVTANVLFQGSLSQYQYGNAQLKRWWQVSNVLAWKMIRTTKYRSKKRPLMADGVGSSFWEAHSVSCCQVRHVLFYVTYLHVNSMHIH